MRRSKIEEFSVRSFRISQSACRFSALALAPVDGTHSVDRPFAAAMHFERLEFRAVRGVAPARRKTEQPFEPRGCGNLKRASTQKGLSTRVTVSPSRGTARET